MEISHRLSHSVKIRLSYKMGPLFILQTPILRTIPYMDRQEKMQMAHLIIPIVLKESRRPNLKGSCRTTALLKQRSAVPAFLMLGLAAKLRNPRIC